MANGNGQRICKYVTCTRKIVFFINLFILSIRTHDPTFRLLAVIEQNQGDKTYFLAM